MIEISSHCSKLNVLLDFPNFNCVSKEYRQQVIYFFHGFVQDSYVVGNQGNLSRRERQEKSYLLMLKFCAFFAQ